MDGADNIETSIETPAVTAPAIRKAGRPKGSKTGTGRTYDKDSRRVRYAQEKAKGKSTVSAEDIEAIGAPKPEPETKDEKPARRKSKAVAMGPDKFAKSLQGLHKGAAFLSGVPELALEPDEAKMMADALFGIFEEYEIEISTKAAAAVNLAGATMMVYGPRLVALRARRNNVARAKAAKTAAAASPADATFAETAPRVDPVPSAPPVSIIDPDMFGE
jgi:hypothetical protein